MKKTSGTRRNPEETRQKLLEATLRLMLRQGFSASTVDQICAEAGLTKGSFFHYFQSKEAIARAAVDVFAQVGTDLYSPAWAEADLDPLEQLHRLIDIMIGFNQRPEEPCVCMVGMMSQELAGTNPEMRDLCARHLSDWADRVTRMLTEAKKAHRVRIDFDADQMAWFLNSLWQGSMLIGKTRETPEMVIQNLHLARRLIDSLFELPSGDSNSDKTPKKTASTKRVKKK